MTQTVQQNIKIYIGASVDALEGTSAGVALIHHYDGTVLKGTNTHGLPLSVNEPGEAPYPEVALDVLKTLTANGSAVEIICDHKNFILTMTSWFQIWEQNGGKKKDGKTPAKWEIYKSLMTLSREISVNYRMACSADDRRNCDVAKLQAKALNKASNHTSNLESSPR